MGDLQPIKYARRALIERATNRGSLVAPLGMEETKTRPRATRILFAIERGEKPAPQARATSAVSAWVPAPADLPDHHPRNICPWY